MLKILIPTPLNPVLVFIRLRSHLKSGGLRPEMTWVRWLICRPCHQLPADSAVFPTMRTALMIHECCNWFKTNFAALRESGTETNLLLLSSDLRQLHLLQLQHTGLQLPRDRNQRQYLFLLHHQPSYQLVDLHHHRHNQHHLINPSMPLSLQNMTSSSIQRHHLDLNQNGR